MSKKEFVFEKTVYLTDANIYGNAYFSRYFDWQGMAREEFLKEILPDFESFFKSGIMLITKSACVEYIEEIKAFEIVVISISIGEVTRASFELLFTYRNKKSKETIATGKQKIVLADSSGKIIAIPDSLKQGAKDYLNQFQKAFLKIK